MANVLSYVVPGKLVVISDEVPEAARTKYVEHVRKGIEEGSPYWKEYEKYDIVIPQWDAYTFNVENVLFETSK